MSIVRLCERNKNALNVFISNRKNIYQSRRNGFYLSVVLHVDVLNNDGKITPVEKNALKNHWYKFEGINPPYKILM